MSVGDGVAMTMGDLNYAELDPGIRRVVAMLRHFGFETTDSGDGVTKFKDPSWDPDELIPFPHVVVHADSPRAAIAALRVHGGEGLPAVPAQGEGPQVKRPPL